MADGLAPVPVAARIVLPGHRDADARMQVVALPFRTRMVRTLALAAGWGLTTVTTFLVTIFDPFMTSLPLLVGTMAVYRSWKGRFRVDEFRGGCPRCGTEMRLKPGSRISLPHPLVCYTCHHEPQLTV